MIVEYYSTQPERQRHEQGWKPVARRNGARCSVCRHVDVFNNNLTCEASSSQPGGVDFSTRSGASCDWFKP